MTPSKKGVASSLSSTAKIALTLLLVGGFAQEDVSGACEAGSDCEEAGLLQVSRLARSVPVADPPVALSEYAESEAAVDDLKAESVERAELTDPLVAPAGTQSFCRNAGARAWVTSKALRYLDESLIPMLLAEITNETFPDIDTKSFGFDIKISNLTFTQLGVRQSSLGFAPGIGLKVNAEGLVSHFNFHYSVKGGRWYNSALWTGGHAYVEVGGNSGFNGILGVALNKIGSIMTSFPDVGVDVDIVHFDIQGSWFGWIIELLTDFMEPYMGDYTQRKVEGLPMDVLNPMLDQMDFQLPLQMPMLKGLNFTGNFTPCAIAIDQDYIALDLPGRLYDAQHLDQHYPIRPLPIPSFPPKAFADDMVAITMTKWTINSGLWTFDQLGWFDFNVTTKDLPSPFDISLDTDLLGRIVPRYRRMFNGYSGYSGYSGDDQQPRPLVFRYTFAREGPKIRLTSKTGVTASAPQSVSVGIIEDDGTVSPALKIIVPLEATAKFSIQDEADGTPERVIVDLTQLDWTPIEVEGSVFGEVELSLLTNILGIIEQWIVLPWARKALAVGFPVPGAMGVQLTDLDLTIDDFISAQGDLEWNVTQTLVDLFGTSDNFLKNFADIYAAQKQLKREALSAEAPLASM